MGTALIARFDMVSSRALFVSVPVLPAGANPNMAGGMLRTKAMTSIYVGNLPYQLTEAELRSAFATYGDVSAVKIVVDRESGRSKGFGFVEMADKQAAANAIAAMNGTDMQGRDLRVNEARPQTSRPRD